MPRRRRAAGWIALAAVLIGLVLLLLFHVSILSWAGHLVYYEDLPGEPVDLVIVLSGNIPDRALEAADLMMEGGARQALLTRGSRSATYVELEKLGIHYPENYEINREVLLARGVEEGRLRILPEAVSSTWEEAAAFRESLAEHPVQSVVISTCRFHSYRAWLNFTRALEGTGVRVYVAPSRYCDFHPDSWWMDRDQTKELYMELASLTAFFLGWR